MENITKTPAKQAERYEWMRWLDRKTYIDLTIAVLNELQADKKDKKYYTVAQIYTVRKGGSKNPEILKALKKVAEKMKADDDYINQPLD